MKPTLKAALVGATLTTVAFLSVLTVIPHDSRAAGPGGGEQYKILSVVKFRGDYPAIEAAINQLGEQGWKVRALIGNGVIMAK